MSEATLTIRVDEVLKEKFAEAAKQHDRTAAQLLRDFMREYVKSDSEPTEHDAWFRQQVQAGLASANANKLIPAADVEAEFAARRAKSRKALSA